MPKKYGKDLEIKKESKTAREANLNNQIIVAATPADFIVDNVKVLQFKLSIRDTSFENDQKILNDCSNLNTRMNSFGPNTNTYSNSGTHTSRINSTKIIIDNDIDDNDESDDASFSFSLSNHVAVVLMIEAHTKAFLAAKSSANISNMRDMHTKLLLLKNNEENNKKNCDINKIADEYLDYMDVNTTGEHAYCTSWKVNAVEKQRLVFALEETVKALEAHFNDCWKLYMGIDYNGVSTSSTVGTSQSQSQSAGIRRFIDEDYIKNCRNIIDAYKKYHVQLLDEGIGSCTTEVHLSTTEVHVSNEYSRQQVGAGNSRRVSYLEKSSTRRMSRAQQVHPEVVVKPKPKVSSAKVTHK